MVGSSDWPLIIFTVVVQLGIGMSLFAGGCFKPANTGGNTLLEKSAFDSIINNKKLLWFIISAITAIGVISSLFHLGRPQMAYLALTNIGVSWLSMEILMVSIFGVFSALTWLMSGKAIFALLTSVIGIAVIVVQGYTYAESALPAIDNAFPLVMFMLSSLVMGAAVFAHYNLLSGSLGALLAVMLTVPCVWASGSPIMKLTAQMWAMSIPYWIGIILLFFALVLANRKRSTFILSILVIVAIFCLRITFFVDTPHEWILLGMPN